MTVKPSTIPASETEQCIAKFVSEQIHQHQPRSLKRLEVCRSVLVIPVNVDCSPELSRQVEGISIDLTLQGIGMMLPKNSDLGMSKVVVGIEGDDQKYYFGVARIEHKREFNEEVSRFGASFLEGGNDLFKPENISPTLDSKTMRFVTGLAGELLQQWEKAGVLRRTIYDRVLCCPKCQSLPTIRNACRQCGSANIVHQRLIHHYACAYVGQHYEFQPAWQQKLTTARLSQLEEAEDSKVQTLICPKCSIDKMVVGVDYEFITGPYECRACHWKDTTLEQYANCLGCGHRACAHQFTEAEVVGYRVARLDSLAFFN